MLLTSDLICWLWNHPAEEDYCSFILKQLYSVFLLSLSCAPQLSQDVLVDAGFECDKVAELSVKMRARRCGWCLILWKCQELHSHLFRPLAGLLLYVVIVPQLFLQFLQNEGQTSLFDTGYKMPKCHFIESYRVNSCCALGLH